MNLDNPSPELVPQRWVRPFNFPPGFWKQQLPGKYLAVGARGDIEALHELLVAHPEFLNKRGSHNRTLLWEATRRGKLAAVKWLAERGAELDATGCYNSESHVQITPYCAAIYYKRADVAAYLHSQNPQHDIFRAAFLGDIARVAEALRADPTLLNAEDPYDNIYFMPLIAFAVVGGHIEMVDFLLRQGVAVNIYSALLLDLAARASRMDILSLLVAHGVDARAADTGIVVTASDLSILEHLLRHGAFATQPGKNGFPPLVYVARADKAERPDKVQLLLEYGALVNAKGPYGKTALHQAARAGHLKVIAVLLEHGADFTLKDHQGNTALRLALAAGKSAVVELFKERGIVK